MHLFNTPLKRESLISFQHVPLDEVATKKRYYKNLAWRSYKFDHPLVFFSFSSVPIHFHETQPIQQQTNGSKSHSKRQLTYIHISINLTSIKVYYYIHQNTISLPQYLLQPIFLQTHAIEKKSFQ